jgi:hypothetical protein
MPQSKRQKAPAATDTKIERLNKRVGAWLERMDRQFKRADGRVGRLTESIASGFEYISGRIDGVSDRVDLLGIDLAKLRDDVRAVDGKVSGIWNVLDQHTDRIKRLESVVFRNGKGVAR